MPNTNQPAGTPGVKQNQDGMFRWGHNADGEPILLAANGQGIGRVEKRSEHYYRATVYGYAPYPWIIEVRHSLMGLYQSGEDAKRGVEEWWRAAAEQARGLGL